MAKIIVDFGTPGLVIGDLTWQAIQRKRDHAAVATTGSTLAAFDSVGKYWLDNPNVTEDTFFDIYVTAAPSSRVLDLFLSPTSLDICNHALFALGGNALSSFTDGTTQAKLCAAFWAKAVDAVLRLHPWNCAITRAQLVPDVSAPLYGWTAAFTLPSDLLRLLDLDGVTDYKVEGGRVLCNESALNVRYVYRNDSPARWDALLVSAVTVYLQFLLAYPLTKSNSTRDKQWELFAELLRTARSIDAQEEPGETVGDFPFLSVRR